MRQPPEGRRQRPAAGSRESSSDGEDRLLAAVGLAARVHAGQVDRGGAPYLLHPIRVAAAVPSGDSRIVALLHDVVEDGGVGLDEIAGRFGPAVAAAVDALSRRADEPYEAFIERCAGNALAVVVKLADLADNLDTSRLPRPLTQGDRARLAKYRRARARLMAAPGASGGVATTA